MISAYFDKIYVLNLQKRKERLDLIQKRLSFCDIENYEVFNGVDGDILEKIHKDVKYDSFANSAYLACSLSHLSIYNHAIEKNYKRILVIEDDCVIHKKANTIFVNLQHTAPEIFASNWDLMYLGFIPLSDDLQNWDYGVFADKFITSNLFRPKNLWGLYSYGISQHMMIETKAKYMESFPMELDRYFVNNIQPKNNSIAICPQLFAAPDGYSDNSKKIETLMLERSIDSRFAKINEYT